MSEQSFLSFLQQILTMVNPNDEESIGLGGKALRAVVELAFLSEKAEPNVLRMMKRALYSYNYLVNNADHFTGVPGHYLENDQKRRRLANVIRPGC